MKLKLRLLVERHRDGRRTAYVLGLPPETGSTPLALVVVGEARPVSQIAAYGDEQADLERVLSREVSRRIEDLDPAVVARWRFDPDERLERIQVPVVPVDWDSSTLPHVTLELAIVVTTWPDPPHRVFVPRLGLVVSVTDPRKAAEAARVE